MQGPVGVILQASGSPGGDDVMKKICVIKAGSAVVTQDDRTLDLNMLQILCRQIGILHSMQWKVILVSSGAVACGAGIFALRKEKGVRHEFSGALSASVGQSRLISYYSSLLNTYSPALYAGQVLISRDTLTYRENYVILQSVIRGMLENDILPIINENDAIGLHDNRFSDNDHLAATISTMIDADLSILISDIDAVYTMNPKNNPDAIPLRTLDFEKESVNIEIDDAISSRGGMKTKLDFFYSMYMFGIDCILVHKDALRKSTLDSIIEDRSIGTRLETKKDKARSIGSYKKWLATCALPRGIVIVSPLGAEALSGKSQKIHRTNLYCAGIVESLGQFDKGEIVSVRDERMALIGIGRTRYSSQDILEAGCRGVLMHDNEFFRMERNLFVNNDKAYIESVLKRMKCNSELRLTINKPGLIIVETSIKGKSEDEALKIEIKGDDARRLWQQAKDAKINIGIRQVDDWIMYAAMEGNRGKQNR